MYEQPSNGSPATINGSPRKDYQSHRLRDHRADPVGQRPVQLRIAFGHASGQSDDQRSPQCRHHQPHRRLALLADHDAVALDKNPKRQHHHTEPSSGPLQQLPLKNRDLVAQVAGNRAKADFLTALAIYQITEAQRPTRTTYMDIEREAVSWVCTWVA